MSVALVETELTSASILAVGRECDSGLEVSRFLCIEHLDGVLV